MVATLKKEWGKHPWDWDLDDDPLFKLLGIFIHAYVALGVGVASLFLGISMLVSLFMGNMQPSLWLLVPLFGVIGLIRNVIPALKSVKDHRRIYKRHVWLRLLFKRLT